MSWDSESWKGILSLLCKLPLRRKHAPRVPQGGNNRSRTQHVSQWHFFCGLFLEPFGGWAQPWELVNSCRHPHSGWEALLSCASHPSQAELRFLSSRFIREGLRPALELTKQEERCVLVLSSQRPSSQSRLKRRQGRGAGFLKGVSLLSFMTVKQNIHVQRLLLFN